MRRTLILTMAMLLCASLVLAQSPGSIALFSDPGATTCNAFDSAPGIFFVYAFHMFTPGGTASQFKVEAVDGAFLTYLSETVTYPKVGTTQTGITITYGGCIGSPNQLALITYFGNGISATCSKLIVSPDPAALPLNVLTFDCSMPVPAAQIASGGALIINPDATCDCNVPTEDTTWGRVKSLFVVE